MKKRTAILALVLIMALAALGIFLSNPRAGGNSDIGLESGQNSAQTSSPADDTGNGSAAGQDVPQASEQAEVSAPVPPGTSPPDAVTVTFVGPDERVLLITEVSRGAAALPPENPNVPQGCIFSHWDKSFTSVTEDLVVRAVCHEIGNRENVIALSGGYVYTGDEIRIPVQLCGDVNLCAFDIRIHYDSRVLDFVEFRNKDGAVDANCSEQTGEIFFNYASAENTNGEVYLADLVFRAAGTPGETTVDVQIVELIAYDSDYNFYEPAYSKIPASLTIAAP